MWSHPHATFVLAEQSAGAVNGKHTPFWFLTEHPPSMTNQHFSPVFGQSKSPKQTGAA